MNHCFDATLKLSSTVTHLTTVYLVCNVKHVRGSTFLLAVTFNPVFFSLPRRKTLQHASNISLAGALSVGTKLHSLLLSVTVFFGCTLTVCLPSYFELLEFVFYLLLSSGQKRWLCLFQKCSSFLHLKRTSRNGNYFLHNFLFIPAFIFPFVFVIFVTIMCLSELTSRCFCLVFDLLDSFLNFFLKNYFHLFNQSFRSSGVKQHSAGSDVENVTCVDP